MEGKQKRAVFLGGWVAGGGVVLIRQLFVSYFYIRNLLDYYTIHPTKIYIKGGGGGMKGRYRVFGGGGSV